MSYPQGFFFKEYPKSDKVIGNEYGKSVFEVSFVENQYKNQQIHYPDIRIAVIETAFSSQEWLDKNGTEASMFDPAAPGNYLYYGVGNKSTKNIGNLQGVYFTEQGTSFGGAHTFFKKGNYLFDITNYTTGVGEISDDVYNQMLSTFKFAN